MKRKINILEICSGLTIGGIERAMQEFALNIDKNRFNVIVAVYDDTGPRKKILLENGIKVVKVKPENLKKLVIDYKIDIVHSHTIAVKQLIGDIPNIQEVVFSGGFAKDADLNMFISKSLALKTSKCLDIKFGKDFIILYYPQNVSSWEKHKLSNLKIREIRENLGIKENELVIGRLGRSEPSKTDYLVLASAGKIAKNHPNIKFVLLGMPLLFRLLMSLNPSLYKKLIFLPESPDDKKIAKFYQFIDVFWHTASWGETFGNVNAEAMIFEKPVITHSTPFKGGNIHENMDNAQIEIVDHMKTGLIANYPDDVVEAVKILHDKNKRHEMGKNGRAKVIKNYDARIVVKQFEKICESIIEEKPLNPVVSKQEVNKFFSEEYKKRLKNSINVSNKNHQNLYNFKKKLYKIAEFSYLIIRFLLRKIGIDLEKLGYNKYSLK